MICIVRTRKFASIKNRKVRCSKVFEFFLSRADQHIAHEQNMIGTRRNHTNLFAILWIPTSKAVKDIQTRMRVEIIDGTFSVDEKDPFAHLHVDRTPLPCDSSENAISRPRMTCRTSNTIPKYRLLTFPLPRYACPWGYGQSFCQSRSKEHQWMR